MKKFNSKEIELLFDSLSGKYDFLNDLFSFGLHRLWKKHLIYMMSPQPGEKWLDLCCGTGDMSILLKDYIKPNGLVIGLDSAYNPLKIAKKRAGENISLQWIKGDALQTEFTSCQFDGVLMAYGLRNLADIKEGLKEALRILKPGGLAGFLDFRSFESTSMGSIFQSIYLSYFVVPLASVFGLGKQYAYIKNSLKTFPSEEYQQKIALEVGFKKIFFQPIAFGQMGILIVQA